MDRSSDGLVTAAEYRAFWAWLAAHNAGVRERAEAAKAKAKARAESKTRRG